MIFCEITLLKLAISTVHHCDWVVYIDIYFCSPKESGQTRGIKETKKQRKKEKKKKEKKKEDMNFHRSRKMKEKRRNHHN